MTGVWLSDDEQRAWRTYLRMSSLLPAALNRQLQQDCGLTLPEYEVLVQLSESPGHRLRPFQICEALNWEQSRLSHQLGRMRARGLVDRHGSEHDKRGATVEVTAAGRAALTAAAPGHVALVRAVLFDGMTADQLRALEEVTTAALARLEE